ncbi:unnamed protein product [Acanthoscelides obtectus]|uniref:HTH psq-type domain-containing protein n=1 Tax=Acanthoscelides obtectus TaxID=200917 RepID=A0A9P0PT04_ACAOB|nr:unnamed protein product [Acanthoscelides obtectus]CAH1997746.1 unnamed protein product [Acanthoscelides obtectus]CAK1630934.1 hypothetical protein AOBTE_LOCUS6653 [Acanthoscelides obtectus]CAK1656539.1 hypothetical protein AOBTE_LOCUS19787 [Acanthoscelides obtectus]
MPRKKRAMRKIGNSSAADVKAGVLLIRQGMSIRKAATSCGVPFTTLKRYYWKTAGSENLDEERFEPNYSVNQIFTASQEEKLKEYFSHCALLFYGLTEENVVKWRINVLS